MCTCVWIKSFLRNWFVSDCYTIRKAILRIFLLGFNVIRIIAETSARFTIFVVDFPSFGTLSAFMKMALRCEAQPRELSLWHWWSFLWLILIYRQSSGCCWLVGLDCANGSAHMAAASFLANLLNLMDSEKALGLHMLALPTPSFLFLFFPSLFLSYRHTVCVYWLPEFLSTHSDTYNVGGSPAPSEPVRSSEQGWGTGARCLPARQRWMERGPCSWDTRFLQHAVTSLQLPPLSDVTWQVRVCVCCFMLSAVGGGVRGRRGLGVMRSWGSTTTNRIWIGLNFRGKDAWEKRGRR